MSDQRPEWMPSEQALTSIEYHAEEALRLGSHRNTHDAMRAFAHRTGLRAQIAALEEMKDVFTGQASTATEEISWTLKSVRYSLENKIAALRKELGE